MASSLFRRPFVASASLRLCSASCQPAISSRIIIRNFHRPSSQDTASKIFKSASSQQAFNGPLSAFKNTFRRQFSGQGYQTAHSTGDLRQRLIYGAAIFGGTLVAINVMFNRETREDGGMPPYERKYLNETFMHTGLGLGIIAIAARALHTNGWSYRLMAMNPWLVAGVGLVGSIGTMYATMYTDPDNYVPKYALWTAFNLTQAALLSPLMFYHPALLARAGLYTAGMIGSIAFVGATAKQDKYLYLGAPLLAGVTIVALSGLAPLVLPVTAARTLAWSENIWLYGGLAVFGGFTLYDVQKVLYHARMSQRGLVKRDPVNESISLELDFINIFVRMVQILAMRNNNRR